jgi:hypothetical protein
MHDRQSSDAMNDDPLARDIERVVEVDPSPEFMVRVRARLAAEPSPLGRSMLFRWMPLTAGWALAASLAVTLYLAGPFSRTAVPVGLSSQQSGAGVVGSVSEGSQSTVADSPARPVSPGGDRLRPRAAHTDAAPRAAVASADRDLFDFRDIIVSPVEAEAVRALIADAHSGRLARVPATELARTNASSDPEELVIEPLEIPPLVRTLSREELEGEVE